MKLQTKEDAERVMAHGTPSVNNRRHYLRYGGVFYPVPSVVWMLETGEWPKSTPRHLDSNPSNNDFGNLRKPGRAKVQRKKAEPKGVHTADAPEVRNPVPSLSDTSVFVYDADAQETAKKLLSLFDQP